MKIVIKLFISLCISNMNLLYTDFQDFRSDIVKPQSKVKSQINEPPGVVAGDVRLGIHSALSNARLTPEE